MTTTQSKRPGRVAAALLAAGTLAGCSSVVDSIPTSLGGLPEGTPPRPAIQSEYPAVHDLPPSRKDGALSAAESQRLREELKKTRNRIAPPAATGSTGGGGNP